MTNSSFKITLVIPKTLVGTIIELLDPESTLISLEPYNGEDRPKRKIRPHTRSGGHHIGPRPVITGLQLILEALDQRPHTNDELKLVFKNANRNPASVSPLISKLGASERIRLGADKRWSLVR